MKYCLMWLVTLIVSASFLSGCGTTSAPTESTTNTSDKTSNSTMDTTSSSTPGESDSAAEAAKFTQNNFVQVKTDMASGGGEHLTALASLLQVPVTQREQFFALSQEKYTVLYQTPNTTPQQMLARLHFEMDAATGTNSL